MTVYFIWTHLLKNIDCTYLIIILYRLYILYKWTNNDVTVSNVDSNRISILIWW